MAKVIFILVSYRQLIHVYQKFFRWQVNTAI